MSISYKAPPPKYVVCYDEKKDFYVCVYVGNGQIVTTGQPNMDLFDTFKEAYAVFGDKITDPTIPTVEEINNDK